MSKNGIEVYDRHRSHSHCSKEDVAAAISSLILEGDFIKTSHVFADRTGLCECVPTTSTDTIIRIQRPGRDGHTRFVLNREPIATRTMTLILKCTDQGYYILITAFWGEPSEPEPWDLRAFALDPRGFFEAAKASKEYWSNHALVFKG